MPFGNNGGEDYISQHPTQKPASLWERAILNHTKRGDWVYDPFGGSGTCLIAAEQTGRRCLMVELDPKWCDLIQARYHAYTGRSTG